MKSLFYGMTLSVILFSALDCDAQSVVKERSQIPEQDQWKLEDIFPTDQAWETAFQNLKTDIPKLTAYKGTLSDSGSQLLQFVRELHRQQEQLGMIFAYSHMKNDQDKSVPEYQAMNDRARALATEMGAAVSFFQPEILAISDEAMKALFTQEKGLGIYQKYFNDIRRRRAHTLSEKEETLLALAGQVTSAPGQIFSVWNSADIQFPKMKDEKGNDVQISNGLYNKYQQSQNRTLRKESYMGLYVPYVNHRNTLATNYSANVNAHVFRAKAKKYDSSLASALDANNVPVSVYHNLLDAVHDGIATLHRYVAIRKRLLKLDMVHGYDLRAPLASAEEKAYPWNEAKDMVLAGLQPMGPEYLKVLKSGFDNRWVDVYETKGKRSGAYSSGAYGVHPYVLLNFNDSLGDVFTLAHEMGHAMHTFYTQENQPFVYGDYPIFLAEVASTANEALLQDYLISKAESKQEKLALLNAYLDQFNGTFFRQALFAEFELKSHEIVEKGEALTADKLDKLFGDIYKFYYGPDFQIDRETAAMWSRIPHFYYNFYVFQYSTSFVASNALVARILKEGPEAQKRFLAFLSSGNTKAPLETLQVAGVDMSTKQPVELTIQRMDKLLDQVDELTK